MQWSPFASFGTNFSFITQGKQRSQNAKVPECKGPPLHNAVIVFHLLKVLLTRYNCLHLILCPRKPLRGLCRWGHLHTLSSAHSYNCTPFHLHTPTTTHPFIYTPLQLHTLSSTHPSIYTPYIYIPGQRIIIIYSIST
jgi:hypothetical protein